MPVPMLIGYSPEVIQTTSRIGDSSNNIINPMMSCFGLIIARASRYDRTGGIGTMIAMMLRSSILFTLAWSALVFHRMFGLDLLVGPGSPTCSTPGRAEGLSRGGGRQLGPVGPAPSRQPSAGRARRSGSPRPRRPSGAPRWQRHRRP
ncbi:MAG: AbgT family transporter, partial [Brevundimonas sp.]|uniref:AbgT family transporter n=1 Tax=Brevundimonas sp. TaxID=1871086 RepID=UPI00391B551C